MLKKLKNSFKKECFVVKFAYLILLVSILIFLFVFITEFDTIIYFVSIPRIYLLFGYFGLIGAFLAILIGTPIVIFVLLFEGLLSYLKVRLNLTKGKRRVILLE